MYSAFATLSLHFVFMWSSHLPILAFLVFLGSDLGRFCTLFLYRLSPPSLSLSRLLSRDVSSSPLWFVCCHVTSLPLLYGLSAVT